MKRTIVNNANKYNALCSLVDVLRKECPWDRGQTLSSLKRHTLEETYEVLEAIDKANQSNDWHSLKDELGDLLFQVMFYARIADEHQAFNIDDVIDSIIGKMIYRHPHVFDGAEPDDIHEQWDALKEAANPALNSIMDGIPPLPALLYAMKIQQRASRVGFDWNQTCKVLEKMYEELEEFAIELNSTQDKNLTRLQDEFGDILFTFVNLGRKLGLDAETCLMQTNRKFINRFQSMESLAHDQKCDLKDLDIDELEELYQTAKRNLNKSKE